MAKSWGLNHDVDVPARPETRAATIVLISIMVGAAVNIATSGFAVSSSLRWWVAGSVLLAGIVWAVWEYISVRRLRVAGTKERPAVWMLPGLERPTGLERPVERASLTKELVALLTSQDSDLIGITALYGAGGFGKTTLAAHVCSLDVIHERFPGGLLWATIGEERQGPELAAIANDLSARLTGVRPEFADPEQAGSFLGSLLDDRLPTLLVLDDVWKATQLRPFTFGGAKTTRLVTTRIPAALPPAARTIRVDEMDQKESRQLIGRELPAMPVETVQALLNLTGNWPLLLAMVNGAIHRRVKDGANSAEAAQEIARQIRDNGPSVLDIGIEQDRNRAVKLTVKASLRPLTPQQRERYFQLGIFAEDSQIPLQMLTILWQETALKARQLCQDLSELSLVKSYQFETATIQLHDVIRDHLRHELGDQLPAVNRAFLDAARRELLPSGGSWWQLPPTADYLWQRLTYHLAETGDPEPLRETLFDLRWGEEKLRRYGLAAYESDLARIDDPTITVLRRSLARKGHILGPIEPAHSHADLLVSRLSEVPELSSIVTAYERSLPQNVARLFNRWPIPPVDPALLRVLSGHTDGIAGCAIASNRPWLATASGDHTISIWDTATWTERSTLSGHEDAVTGYDFSKDGTRLASSGRDGTARIWDTSTWEQVSSFSGHDGPVTGCVFDPLGNWLITTGEDQSARVWRYGTWTLHKALEGHLAAITDCTFSHDGRWLVTASEDRTIHVWNTKTWALETILTGHSETVTACAFSYDGAWLATTSADSTVRIWDTSTWAELTVLGGHVEIVTNCSFAPDGRWLVTTASDHTITLWHTHDWSKYATMRGHTAAVTGCVFSPQGDWMATTSADHNIRVWDMSTEHERASEYNQNRSVTALAVAPDGSWLAAAGIDGMVCIWNTQAPTEVKIIRGHAAAVTDCSVHPHGTYLASGSADGHLIIWNTTTWASNIDLKAHQGAVTSCRFAPDGAFLVTTGMDGVARVWNTATWTIVSVLRGHSRALARCAFSSDGTWLVTAGADSTARVWNTSTWTVHKVLEGHDGPLTDCAFSPDARLLVTTGKDATACVWNTSTWTVRTILRGQQGLVTSCAFAPGSDWLVITGEDADVRVWEATTWSLIAAMRTNGKPNVARWLPQGSVICVGGVGGLYQFTFVPARR